MAAGRRLLAFAPAWMWLFLAARGGLAGCDARRSPTAFLSHGAIEVWHGTEREPPCSSSTQLVVPPFRLTEPAFIRRHHHRPPPTSVATSKWPRGRTLAYAATVSGVHRKPVWLPSEGVAQLIQRRANTSTDESKS